MQPSWVLPPLLLAAAFAWAATPAAALESRWIETEQTAVRFISAAEGTGAERSLALGLHFRLKDGWKIYWRSPGDAGFPPRLDFSGSRNLARTSVSWPAPRRFSILGFETSGYEDEVVLPVAATLVEAGRELSLRAKLDYLTCKEICIPVTAELGLDVPAGPSRPGAAAHLINRYSTRVPGDGAAHGLAIEAVEAAGAATAGVLRIAATSIAPFVSPDVFVEGPPEFAFGAPRRALSEAGRRAVLEVDVFGSTGRSGVAPGTRLTVTLTDGQRAAERTLTVAPGAASGLDGWLLPMMGLAVLGGLILNLMPCVLPVLSLKLMGVVSHGGAAARVVRLNFLASAAGIVVAFLVLAGALIGLKAAGAAVGWGIQFQQPWFLVAMTFVVVLFACNLWGFLDVALPRWIADAGVRRDRVRGLGGSFLAGAFATLLATPCSAPFLGTAVGFALARGGIEIVAIFLGLGLGLALPYLVVAALPALARRLPRPGPWIARLRFVLGWALAATAAWLVSVLASTTGAPAASAVGVAATIGALLLILGARFPARLGRIWLASFAAIAALTAVAAPALRDDDGSASAATRFEALWRPFDEPAIAEFVGEGKTVLVDVTADWCITCQVNKQLVLFRGEVFRRLSQGEVVAMRADWTQPDPAIARYLSGFGRYGVPFNAVYGPGLRRGLALSEILTESAVLSAFDQAAGRAPVAAR